MEVSHMQEDQPRGKTRSRRLRLVLVMAAVSIVIIMILSIFAFPGAKTKADTVFLPGDHLTYTITGNLTGGPIVSTSEILLHDGTIISYTSSGLPDFIDTTKYLWTENGKSSWVCDHRINTSWGEKTVSSFFEYAQGASGAAAVLTDVGIDSSVIYRTTYFTPEILVSSVLTATNSSRIQSADVRTYEGSATGSHEITSIPNNATILHNTGGPISTTFLGSLRLTDGQHLRYNLTAQGCYFLVFSQQDLIDTADSNQLHYQQEASLGMNQTGEINKALPNGSYWYCMAAKGLSVDSVFRFYW